VGDWYGAYVDLVNLVLSLASETIAQHQWHGVNVFFSGELLFHRNHILDSVEDKEVARVTVCLDARKMPAEDPNLA
jgi:hypothetical protein